MKQPTQSPILGGPPSAPGLPSQSAAVLHTVPLAPLPAGPPAATPLAQARLTELLDRLPDSVKTAGRQVAARYHQLSTTQKVVGGTLLVLAVRRLLRGPKAADKKGRRKTKQAQAGTLHELLYFVNDRVAGYQKAVQESQDPQRRGYYHGLVSQSQQFAQTLNAHLGRLGGGRETSTTLKGKLYRRFMAAAAVFTGHDEATVLASNIHGEQWAVEAYEAALADHTLRGQEVERQYRLAQKTYQALSERVLTSYQSAARLSSRAALWQPVVWAAFAA